MVQTQSSLYKRLQTRSMTGPKTDSDLAHIYAKSTGQRGWLTSYGSTYMKQPVWELIQDQVGSQVNLGFCYWVMRPNVLI